MMAECGGSGWDIMGILGPIDRFKGRFVRLFNEIVNRFLHLINDIMIYHLSINVKLYIFGYPSMWSTIEFKPCSKR